MKLFEIKNLQESIEVLPAQQVWDQNSESSTTFISRTVYLGRQNDSEKFEVYIETGGKRKLYATMSETDFVQAFTKINNSSQPDVEGFEKYRDASDIEAIKYSGETVKLDAGHGKTLKLSKGDYLIKSDDGDDFVYFVETSTNFEGEYVKK